MHTNHWSGNLIGMAMMAIVFIFTTGFRSTDVSGHTDPDFPDYKFKKVVLQMPNASVDFEKYVVDKLTGALKKKGIGLVLYEDILPPTREWDAESITQAFEKNGVQAALIIFLGTSSSSSTPYQMLYNETTTTTSHGSQSSGSATVMTIEKDVTEFEMTLMDIETSRTVWVGDLKTKGSGSFFVGSKSTASGLVKGLTKELEKAGHLPK